jgi:hypothetical protein
LLFVFETACAQIIFEKGYFIDTTGHKITCLIRNSDWDNNPRSFEYKLTSDGETRKASVFLVKEFAVDGYSRYISAGVLIDTSSSDLSKLSRSRMPQWKKDTVFLKVLVEGSASLYYYRSGQNLIRFFYRVKYSPIKQLISKDYAIDQSQIAVNSDFRKQLSMDINCPEANPPKTERLNYRKGELVKYFHNYNNCAGDKPIIVEQRIARELFNFRITPGVNYSTITLLSGIGGKNASDTFNHQVNLRGGVEAEFVLPFNKNKWSILFEPYYQSYRSRKEIDGREVNIKYQAIEMATGARHYIFLKKNTKIFVNAILNFGTGIYFDSKVDYGYLHFDVRTGFNYAAGAGLSHKRFSTELRYFSVKNILDNYSAYASEYRVISIILGYRFFTIKKSPPPSL